MLKNPWFSGNVLHESLRQSVTASKEHYLSNANPCDGKMAQDFSIWLEDVSRISNITCKDTESVALATSRGSLHKYVRELQSSGKHWSAMKPLLQDFQSVEIPQWPSIY